MRDHRWVTESELAPADADQGRSLSPARVAKAPSPVDESVFILLVRGTSAVIGGLDQIDSVVGPLFV
ncbi:hypothetical protein Csp1_26090 [Corynebacterium provencense]|uniref:Uncharacterized protein n=1 Tax=Corynebacterium provencense TaxID=1737425 RepID=A0A2Z3Z183_9CORY|nr:hypothetical protein Csp1_26090 [Corynebacterium provencense]